MNMVVSLVHKLGKKGFGLIRMFMSRYWARIDRQIPKTDLRPVHIAGLRMLTDRLALLKELPKNAVVAELGVDTGDFSEQILQICQPKKLHLVDFWGSKRYDRKKRERVETRFEALRRSGTVQIDLGLSTEVVVRYPDDYFDWIYIDTDHGYRVTIDELRAYAPKVRPGGIIAGHDYIIGNWIGMVRYGVIEAVHEFCMQDDWELIHITMELTNNPSFAIRRTKR